MADRSFFSENKSFYSGLTVLAGTFKFGGQQFFYTADTISGSTTFIISGPSLGLQPGDLIDCAAFPIGTKVVSTSLPNFVQVDNPASLSGSFDATFTRAGQPDESDFRGVSSITRNGIGAYQLTLQDRYPKFFHAEMQLKTFDIGVGNAIIPLLTKFGETIFQGAATAGSPTITDIPVDTAQFEVGQTVRFFDDTFSRLTGYINPQSSTILSIPSSSSITLSDNAVNTQLVRYFKCDNSVNGFGFLFGNNGSMPRSEPTSTDSDECGIAMWLTNRLVDIQ